MADSALPIDLTAAHRWFSTQCFNGVWSYLDRAIRRPEDHEQMQHLAHASLWHWLQRPDCTPRNLSIGYWQLSRVYAVSGDAGQARLWGERCLQFSEGDVPFYAGYAHEALARAAMVAGDSVTAAAELYLARKLAGQVSDPEEQKMLLADLDSLQLES